MDTPELIELYASERFVVDQISPDRQRQARSILGKVAEFIAPRPLLELKAEDVELWQTGLIASGRHNPTSCRTYLGHIKPFVRWCAKRGLMEAGIVATIREVQPPRGAQINAIPNPYKRAELKEFWRALDETYPYAPAVHVENWRKGRAKYRQRMYHHAMRLQIDAVVSLALTMGLRRAEMWAMNVHEMHPDNAYVSVKGKREDYRPKLRDVPYTETARAAVIAWYAHRRQVAPLHDSPWISVYYKNPGEPLSLDGFGDILDRIPGHYTLHRFRHTFATERLRAGARLEHVSELMGHASIQQTLAYAKLAREDIEKDLLASDDAFNRAVGLAA